MPSDNDVLVLSLEDDEALEDAIALLVEGQRGDGIVVVSEGEAA